MDSTSDRPSDSLQPTIDVSTEAEDRKAERPEPQEWYDSTTMVRHESQCSFANSMLIVTNRVLHWRELHDDRLNMSYTRLLCPESASGLMEYMEGQVRYLPPERSQVKIRGEWRNIPREVAAFGDGDHLRRHFCGTFIEAEAWIPMLQNLRDAIASREGIKFNFALVNRFADGKCGIGCRKEGQPDSPIVVVTLDLL